MSIRRFPRAREDLTIVYRDDWNRLVETVEALADFAVCPPLELVEGGAGNRTLRLRPRVSDVILVQIQGNYSGGGFYSGKAFRASIKADGTTNLGYANAALNALTPAAADTLLWNPGEFGMSTHSLTIGSWGAAVLCQNGIASPPLPYSAMLLRELPVASNDYEPLQRKDDAGTIGFSPAVFE